jgi:sec-independent protein translocase protein TatA
MLSNIGPGQLVIILLIVLLLFGAKKIPEIAKGLGKGIKDFKGALKEDEEEAGKQKSVTEDKSANNPPPT